MKTDYKIVVAKCVVGVAVLPVLLWAYATGPDAHRTGVPVPNAKEPNCSDVGCHIGSPVNGSSGTVTVTSSEGTTYTPGQKQTLTIQITDPAGRLFGFQATARLVSDLSKQAGTFTPSSSQLVLCAAVSLNDLGVTRPGATCSAAKPLEFIEHSTPARTGTITVSWTPPSTASGAIAIYVSGNAANGNGLADAGDHIYTANITLQPAGGGAQKPAIFDGGIINAAGFGGQKGVAPGTWLEIYGTNLSTTTGEWTGSDFKGNTAPTSIGGVTVSIAGKLAFIRFISPGQINVQAPDGIGTGPVPVVITNSNGTSDASIVTATDKLPGFLAPFGNGHIAAFQGSTIVGSPGFAPVKPGDTITLYAIGCGAVSPTIPAGQIAGALNNVTNPLKILIGQSQALASYQGLGPGFIGLYQFNVQVPNVPDGEQPVTLDLGGGGTGQTLTLTVKK